MILIVFAIVRHGSTADGLGRTGPWSDAEAPPNTAFRAGDIVAQELTFCSDVLVETFLLV